MTETMFAMVASYGVAVILLSAYFSCLGVPVPTAFVMLAGGAFVASGDLDGASVLGAALIGAVLGDQTGFNIGRIGGATLTRRMMKDRKRAAALGRARRFMDRWGAAGVFFSTWLMSPLGPYVNLLAGATRMNWMRFTFWDTVGETIWVGFYVAMGYLFAARIAQLAELLANSVAFLTAASVTTLMGLTLYRLSRMHPSAD
ncbi:DedA family protein [Chelativorans alearense]|uniref:DedA family protein n=1 Tax=Chelativorans alearense TaxID=2681495 RepID=UPI0013CFD7C3|nr:DedA family protein [Chelativorans alearense]